MSVDHAANNGAETASLLWCILSPLRVDPLGDQTLVFDRLRSRTLLLSVALPAELAEQLSQADAGALLSLSMEWSPWLETLASERLVEARPG